MDDKMYELAEKIENLSKEEYDEAVKKAAEAMKTDLEKFESKRLKKENP